MKDEINPTGLSDLTFINPAFCEPWKDKDYHRKAFASTLANEVNAMLRAAHSAYENDTSGIPMQERGIGLTLEVAIRMAGDLVDRCEELERQLELARSMPVEATTPQQRLERFSEWTQTTPPKHLLDADGAPTDELLAYCRAQKLSLDWVFLGDEKALVLGLRRKETETA